MPYGTRGRRGQETCSRPPRKEHRIDAAPPLLPLLW